MGTRRSVALWRRRSKREYVVNYLKNVCLVFVDQADMIEWAQGEGVILKEQVIR